MKLGQLPRLRNRSDATKDRSHQPPRLKGTVSLRGVTKRYGNLEAVSNLSLEVAAGEFLAILGPSGSGKTTTMRIIGGFVQPDSGTVEISGVNVGHLPPFHRDVNTVFQSYALFPHMSVEDNVAYGLRMKRVSRKARRRRAAEMLQLVQLSHSAKQRPAELSGGMQQRVAVARALASNPSVLLLDEPLGALDRKLREEMQFELRHIQTTIGTTFIYVTHDQDEALGLSDRLVVMRDGRIEQTGPPAEVYDSPATLWVAGFVGSSNQLEGVVAAIGAEIEVQSDSCRILAGNAHCRPQLGDRVVAVIRPEDVKVSKVVQSKRVNHVLARIEDHVTVGGQVRVVARTNGGLELTAQVPRAALGDGRVAPGPGEEVNLEWEPRSVHLYARPAVIARPARA
jgi:ABC-type Fe3+/spermidine/putrescine transport system ATPase subunit